MAKRGKATKRTHMFVADFETCDSDELSKYWADEKQLYKQRVWLAGLKNLANPKRTKAFKSLDGFMKEILSRGDNQNREIAFHNLKFDGSYIVPWLLNNGYQSTTERPRSKEFGVLVTDRNDWYSITIQVTRRRKVTIWDSAKLFPMQLRYVPDVYYTPTRKIEEPAEFYERKRPEDHQPTREELQYLENDLKVLEEALNAHIDRYGLRFKKTQAGQSWYDFTKQFKAWKLRFPPLETELDKEMRQAYWGGISHVPKKHAGKDYYNIRAMDINSSYPHKAAYEKLPYGEMLFELDGEHPDMSKFWVGDALVRFKLKPNALPCIPSKALVEGFKVGDLNPDKWMEESDGIVRIKFSSIDYKTINMSYDFEVIAWNKTYHFKQRVIPEITKFVENNNNIKIEGRAKARQLTESDPMIWKYLADSERAKTNNNSFYGKFGEEIEKESKTPYIDEHDEEDIIWETDNFQELTDAKKKYLPVAIAITAYGRQQLVELANALGEHFLYCDTDSVHFLEEGGIEKVDKLVENGTIKMDPLELGAWDIDGDFKRGRFLRAKAYKEDDEVTLAGLPADPNTGQFSKVRSAITWDNFHIGHVVPREQSHKLRSVRTETGTKLLPIEFSIKEHANSFIL